MTGESYESNRPPIHSLLLVSLGKLYDSRLRSTQNKSYVSKVGFPEHLTFLYHPTYIAEPLISRHAGCQMSKFEVCLMCVLFSI